MSDRKFTDYILVNGERRFFVASEVTEELLAELKREIGDSVGNFYGTEFTPFSEWLEAYQNGKTLFFKKLFTDEDHSRNRVYRMVNFDNSRDYDTFTFVCLENDAEYKAVLWDTYVQEWTFAEIGLATKENLSTEATIRSSADTNLQQQIDENKIEIDENLDTESQNPVENRAVAEAMNGKQDQLTEMTDQEINDLINSLGDL